MTNKKTSEETDKEEYVQFLEEQIAELMMALLVDMQKHGIIERNGDYTVSKKFKNEVVKKIESSKLEDPEEKIEESIVNTISEYYKDALEEDELYPRGNILAGYLFDELMDKFESK